MNFSIDTLIQNLSGIFEKKREKKQATIVGIERSEQSGRQGYVLAEIQRGEGSSYLQKIFVGDAGSYTVGDQYWVRGSGNPVDPDWQFGAPIKQRNPPLGADVDKPIVVLTIPIATNPDDGFSNPVGVVTEQDLNSTTGANGEPQAIARIYYRTIVPGSHTVYDPSTLITHVVPQVRRVIDENWRTMPAVAIWPPRAKRLRLTPGIDENDLVAGFADDDGVAGDDWPIGHYVYWQIDGEILLAKVAANGTATILARGVEGTTAVSHASNAAVLLLSGMAVLAGLDPGVNHEVRVAAQTGHNQVGPPSVSVAFVTWQRTSIPGLTGAQYSVEMRSNGFHLEWERPTDPTSMLPHTGRLLYRIYRNTTNSTSGAKIVAEGVSGFSVDIPATLWDTPATQADAYWFGIEPYDSFGNEGTILWEKDDEPPQRPVWSSWSVLSLEKSIKISYDPLRDDANADGNGDAEYDPGFSHFAVYRATDDSGSDETLIGKLFAGSLTYEPPFDQLYYYQVVSVDWARNANPRLTGDLYWKRGIPSWIENSLVNGNFQIPGPVRTVTVNTTNGNQTITSSDAVFSQEDIGQIIAIIGAGPSSGTLWTSIVTVTDASTAAVHNLSVPQATITTAGAVIGNMPKYWRTLVMIRRVGHIDYLPNLGQTGNWGLRAKILAGTYGVGTSFDWVMEAVIPRPYNPSLTQADIAFSLKVDTGITVNWAARFYLVNDDYSKPDQSVFSSAGVVSGSHAGTGQWVVITGTNTDATMFDATNPIGHAYIVELAFNFEGGVLGADKWVYLDDISVDIS